MKSIWVILVGLAVGLSACGGTAIATTSPAGTSPAATAPPTATPTQTPEPTPTATPEPTPTPFTEYQAVEDLAVGDCYDPIRDKDDDNLLAAAIRDCDDPHFNEVFGVLLLPDPPSAPYPIQRDLEDASIELCDPAFDAYVGVSIDASRYVYLYYTPTAGTWAAGDRLVLCAVDDRGDQMTGSVKGTGD